MHLWSEFQGETSQESIQGFMHNGSWLNAPRNHEPTAYVYVRTTRVRHLWFLKISGHCLKEAQKHKGPLQLALKSMGISPPLTLLGVGLAPTEEATPG